MTLKCTLNYIPIQGTPGRIEAQLQGSQVVIENHAQACFQPGDRFELEQGGQTDTLTVAGQAHIDRDPSGSITRWHIPVKRAA